VSEIEIDRVEVQLNLVRVGPGDAALPRSFIATGRIIHGQATYPIRLVCGFLGSRPRAFSVAVGAADEKSPPPPEALRWMASALDSAVEKAAERATIRIFSQDTSEEVTRTTFGLGDADQIDQLHDVTRTRRKVTRAVLEEVATVWEASGGSLAAVKDHFMVSQRTAYRYVRLARETGCIPQEEN
jgi:hypothetical protein